MTLSERLEYAKDIIQKWPKWKQDASERFEIAILKNTKETK